jgi:hypothetical protein
MSIKVKDGPQLRLYHQLSLANQATVDRMVEQYLKACAALGVEPEVEVTFREAVDMVVKGNWEPDQPRERSEPRWQYGVYIPPHRDDTA